MQTSYVTSLLLYAAAAARQMNQGGKWCFFHSSRLAAVHVSCVLSGDKISDWRGLYIHFVLTLKTTLKFLCTFYGVVILIIKDDLPIKLLCSIKKTLKISSE